MIGDNGLTGDTTVELKKKGRKPKQANYFDVQEELAVNIVPCWQVFRLIWVVWVSIMDL